MKSRLTGSLPTPLIWSLTILFSVIMAGCNAADLAPGSTPTAETPETLSGDFKDRAAIPMVLEDTAGEYPEPVPTIVAVRPEDQAVKVPSESAREESVEEGPADQTSAPSLPSARLDAAAVVAAQEEVLARIYEEVLPSVVYIRVSRNLGPIQDTEPPPNIPEFPFDFEGFPNLPRPPQGFYQRGEGSGFVWDEQGHIVTNHHVIEGSDTVTVEFADGKIAEAEVLGSDPDSDLAVLKVDASEGSIHPVTLGNSEALRVGHTAIAVGNPFGQEFTMTSGIVSALGRTIRSGNSPFSTPEVIQTDAPINPGNSGGPLLDRHGQVIGVNTQIISRSGASAGIGFAVPINTAKRVVPILIEEGTYEYAWLGISGTDLSPEVAEFMDLPADTDGALVIAVAQDSPADRAGIRGSDKTLTVAGIQYPLGGDVIVGIDGIEVLDMDDLIGYLTAATRPDDEVTLDVVRDEGRMEKIKVRLGKRPSSGGLPGDENN